MPKINEMQKTAQNQTAENQINPVMQEMISLCEKNCGELGLEYYKILDDIQYRFFGCYCSWFNGYGDNYIRIW
jgi:hypothetical protein